MYAPDRRDERDYRSERDYRGERYYEDERVEYKGPAAGALVARGRDDFSDARGYQVAVSRCFGHKAEAQKLTLNSHTKPRNVGTIRAWTIMIVDALLPSDGTRRGLPLDQKNITVARRRIGRAHVPRKSSIASWPR